MPEPWLDGVLVLALVGVAWRSVASRDLFVSAVLYIVFGLLLALAWVRLDAPDIALAEAAVGAGLTGALLLDAIRALEGRSPRGRGGKPDARAGWVVAAAAAAGVAALLGAAVLALPPGPAALGERALAELERSGVAHPVTAVLLDFRGYDTLLELGVLLVAAAALLALCREPLDATPAGREPDPVLAGGAGLVIPVMVLVAGYLLWRGSHAPGGAFPAGAVLGAAGVLLVMAGHRGAAGLPPLPLRTVLAAGFIAFLLAGAGGALAGGAFLEHPAPYAGSLILLVETAAAVSIGATLAVLFAGAR